MKCRGKGAEKDANDFNFVQFNIVMSLLQSFL